MRNDRKNRLVLETKEDKELLFKYFKSCLAYYRYDGDNDKYETKLLNKCSKDSIKVNCYNKYQIDRVFRTFVNRKNYTVNESFEMTLKALVILDLVVIDFTEDL